MLLADATPELPAWLPFVAFAAIAAAGGLLRWWRRKQRSAIISREAPLMGCEYIPWASEPPIGPVPLFTKGRDGRFLNIVRWPATGNAAERLIFDYQDNIGRTVRDQTVVAFRFHGLAIPWFELRQENASDLSSIWDFSVGYGGLEFASHPVFSQRYVLSGPDEEHIRNLFKPALLEFFERRPSSQFFGDQFNVEGAGEWVIVYRARRLVKLEDFLRFMDEAWVIAGEVFSAAGKQEAAS